MLNFKSMTVALLCAIASQVVLATGTLTVNNGAQVFGNGHINSNSQFHQGATFSPGNALGLGTACITTTHLNLNAGSHLTIGLLGESPCTQHDQLTISGTVNLASSQLNLSVLNDYIPNGGTQFQLISNDGSDAISGEFVGLTEGAIIPLAGKNLSISYRGGDGNDVELTTLLDQHITFPAIVHKTISDDHFSATVNSDSGLDVNLTSTSPTICSVSGHVISLINTGQCALVASQNGTSQFNAAAVVNQHFNILKATQSISFGAIENRTFNDENVVLKAISSAGLQVNYASTTTDICTILGNTVSLVSAGHCSINANQAGNDNYLSAAEVSQAFSVIKAPHTLTFNPLTNKTFGDSDFGVNATSSASLPVSYASSTTDICTVSGNSVTLISAGHCSISVNQAGNNNYLGASPVTQSFTVSKAVQILTFNPLTNKIFGDSDFGLNATNSASLPVSYASSTTDICTVLGNTVSLVSVGHCSITATQTGNGNYESASPVTQSFTVSKAVQILSFNPLTNKIFGDSDFVLNATSSASLPVSYASSTTDICTVLGNTVSLVSVGHCSITATQTGNGNYESASPVTRSFTVSKAVQILTFNPLTNKVFGDSDFGLSATNSASLPVSYASSTTDICTVLGNTVSLVSVGHCSISVNQAGNINYLSASPVTQSFTVSKAVQTLTFNPLANKIFGDSDFGLSATSSASLPVSYASSTTDICAVTGNSVTLISAGHCSISVNQAGNNNYLSASPVTQSFTISKAVQTLTFNPLANKIFGDSGFDLTASSNTGLPVSYASSTTDICTVLNNTVALVSAGHCSITATQTGNGNYESASPVARSFTVSKAVQTLTFNPLANKIFGDSDFTLSASSSAGLSVNYSSSTTNVCTVLGNTVSLVSAGHCSINADQLGNNNYLSGATISQSFMVIKAPQSITFNAISNKALTDDDFIIHALSHSGLPISYSTTSDACRVHGAVVQLITTGRCAITAAQVGNANFQAASDVIQHFSISDTTKPIITLIGESPQIINYQNPYIELGATAIDGGKNISHLISIDAASVNTQELGEYLVLYTAVDDAGNEALELKRIVKVVDKLAPVITTPPASTIAAINADGTPASNTDITLFLTSVTAIDNVDGLITTITHDAPDTLPLGKTVVNFSVNDNAGNMSTAQSTLTINDESAPIINLLGSDSITLKVGDLYTELGATAVDNVDGDVTSKIVISGNVDVSNTGLYTVNYNVQDAVGNKSNLVSRKVSVQDTASPIVTAPASLIVAAIDQQGAPATENAIHTLLSSASANDSVDGAINPTHNAPDIFPLGTTTVTFSAVDQSGNIGQAQTTITVTDQTAPTLSVQGETSITLSIGDNYVESGVIAHDNVDGDIPHRVIISGNVNVNIAGLYRLAYQVSDAAGNKSPIITRQISIQDNSAPVISAPSDLVVAAFDHLGTPNDIQMIANFLSSVSAVDLIDGPVNVTNSAPSIFPLGTTIVTFSSTDASGNIGYAQSTITVADQTSPLITLLGEATVSIAQGDNYHDSSATGLDNVNGDISHRIELTGHVDTQVLGSYDIHYNLIDTAGNKAIEVIRTVNVTDQTLPIITLLRSDNISVAQGASYIDSGAVAIDNNDGDITASINSSGNVDTANTGVYHVSFKVTDASGNAALPVNRIVTVNDETPPVINLNGQPIEEISKGNTYIDLGATATDNNDGLISNNIVVSGAVDNNTLGTYSLIYSVMDNAGNRAKDVIRRVTVIDIDTDNDGIGDTIDTDDDNDGINDSDDIAPLDNSIGDNQAPVFPPISALTFEATSALTTVKLPEPEVIDNNSMLPIITSNLQNPLAVGEHVVIWTATDVANNQSSASQVITIVDTTAPVFEPVSALTINADGRLTNVLSTVSNNATLTAFDRVDGYLPVSITSDSLLLSGHHQLELIVQDSAGNKRIGLQTLNILPQVAIRPTLNVAAGGEYSLGVTLSGEAPQYPVEIAYDIIQQDNVIERLTISLDTGTHADITIKIPEELATSDTFMLQLTNASNAYIADSSETQFNIIDSNIAPTLDVQLLQNEKQINVIDPNNGNVTLIALINDINQEDTHNISWSNNDGLIPEADNKRRYEVDPSTLNNGVNFIDITAMENNTTDALTTTLSIQVIVEALPPLSPTLDNDGDGVNDAEEGYSDSDLDGISDYLDNDNNTARLPSSPNESPLYTSPGLTLSLGSINAALGANKGYASLTNIELTSLVGTGAENTHNNHFQLLTPLYNFILKGLNAHGDSAAIVIPLPKDTSLPHDAVYRKYNTRNGWYNFIEDNKNQLGSARVDKSYNCPPASSELYTTGLTAGDQCVQLVIEDGGPNDADFSRNGSIEDPGAIGIEIENSAPVISLPLRYQVNENTPAVLNASQTIDAEGDVLTYHWSQIDGQPVNLVDTSQYLLHFTSPQVERDSTLTFQLVVGDGGNTSIATIEVLVHHINQAPIVSIMDLPAQVLENTSVSLIAQASDSDGDAITYQWQQLSGPTVTFSHRNTADTTISLPNVDITTQVILQVTASDSNVSSTATKTLIVTNISRGGGTIGWFVLLICCIVFHKRLNMKTHLVLSLSQLRHR